MSMGKTMVRKARGASDTVKRYFGFAATDDRPYEPQPRMAADAGQARTKIKAAFEH